MPKELKTISKRSMRAAKALVKKYRSLTKRKILNTVRTAYSSKTHNLSTDNLTDLTGFGTVSTCTLCRASASWDNFLNCTNCIHGVNISKDHEPYPCVTSKKSKKTYAGINDVLRKVLIQEIPTDEQIAELYITAVNNRADYIEKQIKLYNKKRGILDD